MNHHGAIVTLRWGLAFVFFYAAVFMLLKPQVQVDYLPSFVVGVLPWIHIRVLLTVFAVYELWLAALLFWGRKLKTASLASAITLFVIIVLNLGSLDILFPNIGLGVASLALFELVRERKDDAPERE